MEVSFIKESWFEILASRKRELLTTVHGSRKPRLIAVFGGSAVKKGSKAWRWSYDTGAALAKRGAIVMNGAYGGVMEASAAGAQDAGGITVGITCSNLPVNEPNEYIQHRWHVPRWDQRLLALVFLADGYVVMPGSSGTLVELSVVIETQLKGFIPIRPVVCYGRYWQPVVKRIIQPDGMVYFARKPEQVAQIVMDS